MEKYLYKLLIVPVVLGLMTGCGSGEEHVANDLPAVPVKVATASSVEMVNAISVSGKIEASKSANMSTRMMGNVKTVNVKAGSQVSKGDLLLTISSSDLSAKQAQVEASIAQARSGYENAKKDLERFEVLFEKGSASEKELENIKTRFEMAEAGLEAAEQMKREVDAQFAYTHLRAPFSGVVANTFVKVGDIAAPGMPLVTVEGTESYQAALLVPESSIATVKVGADVTAHIKSLGKRVKGKVVEVSPSSKNTGSQFIVKVDLMDEEGIYPGMFVSASITTKSDEASKSPLMISKDALVTKGQLTGLYTISADNKAVLRWVRTGKSIDGKVEVLTGLTEGEKYVVMADGKLFNGAIVQLN